MLILPLLFFLLFNLSFAQDKTETGKKVRLIADAVIKDAGFKLLDENGIEYTSAEKISSDTNLKLQSPYNDWRYWNGVLNIAMVSLGETLHDTAYLNFPQRNIWFCFNNYSYFEKKHKDENKWNYPLGQFFVMEELDDCGAMGASVIEIFKKEKHDEFEKYIDKTAEHIMKKQDRLRDGTLVRSFPHKWTLWADDLYMGLSFISRMGELTGNQIYFDFAAEQVINFHKYLFDENKKIMYHCWYSDTQQNGVAFWGRANGWALVAQAELLERLPEKHPQRDTLLKLFIRHVNGILHFQGSNGLWHQLLDKEDSYQETSCSAMFVYTIAKAVNKKNSG